MLSYCLKCRKNTESINPKALKTTNGKTMILSKCAIRGSKKSKFIKEQQAKGLLSNLGIQKFKETGDTNYTYKNELDKACFTHDAAYSDSKDLTKRTAADKILRNRAFNIAKDPKYDGYQRGLASMVYKFFDKKPKGSGAKHVNAKLTPQNQQLAEELHKPIIKKFEKRKVHAAFKDNIWGADLADMQLLRK